MTLISNFLYNFFADTEHHPYALFLLLTGGGLVLAVCSYFFLNKYAKLLVIKTSTQFDDHFLQAFQIPIAISFALGGLWHGLNSLTLKESFAHTLFSILATITILSWTYSAFTFSTSVVDHMSHQPDRYRFVRDSTKPLFQMMFKSLAVLVSSYLIIIAWGQDIGGWLASAGVAGIAIGFAAKDTLANFFAGVFIIADSPYKIGDYILLDSGDRGRVTDIGLRSTRLLTRDDVEVIIPNAIMGNTKVTNQSGGPYEKMRVRIPVSVAYGSDIDLVRKTLMASSLNVTYVESEPAPRVRFRSFGDSGLLFDLLVWVIQPERRGEVVDLLLDRIYKNFNANGIEIPYQKIDMQIKEWPSSLEKTKADADKD